MTVQLQQWNLGSYPNPALQGKEPGSIYPETSYQGEKRQVSSIAAALSNAELISLCPREQIDRYKLGLYLWVSEILRFFWWVDVDIDTSESWDKRSSAKERKKNAWYGDWGQSNKTTVRSTVRRRSSCALRKIREDVSIWTKVAVLDVITSL